MVEVIAAGLAGVLVAYFVIAPVCAVFLSPLIDWLDGTTAREKAAADEKRAIERWREEQHWPDDYHPM